MSKNTSQYSCPLLSELTHSPLRFWDISFGSNMFEAQINKVEGSPKSFSIPLVLLAKIIAHLILDEKMLYSPFQATLDCSLGSKRLIVTPKTTN